MNSDSKRGETACPICGTTVPGDADECPKCGEPFTPQAINKKMWEDKGSKRLFWIGVILTLGGGPGISLGVWLIHAKLEIPIGNFTAWESFGWVNQTVATIGIIIMVIGIICLILSLPKLKDDGQDEDINEKESNGDQGG